MDHTTDMMIDAMARALYVEAYASAVEAGTIEGSSAGAGEDWMDVAPPTPTYAREYALILTGRIEERNGMSLICLLHSAARADGVTMDEEGEWTIEPQGRGRLNYCETFGHYLAMQSLGHGVGWFDDHKRFPLSLPLIDSLEVE